MSTRKDAKELAELSLAEANAVIDQIIVKIQRSEQPDFADEYFMAQIQDAVQDRFIAEIRERQARIPGLKTASFGHVATWGGELSPGCQHCVDHGFSAIRSASDCNLSCSFCYYGESRRTVKLLRRDQFEVSDRPVTARELKAMFSKAAIGPGKLESVAWVFLEPFTEFEKHPELIAFIHELGLYQHLYTNGTLATPAMLEALGKAGLDEIRFNLAASKCADNVIEAMGAAREHIPHLCVESPMVPEYFEQFKLKRKAILATGVDYIHCAELHLNAENFGPYRDAELYQYSRGYVSPMFSRRLTYDLIDLAEAEQWKDVVINDCSNEVKFLRGASRDNFGVLDYQPELSGVPIWWFRQALERYNLTK